MALDEALCRVVGDQKAPIDERVAAIAALARQVGPDLEDRAELWGTAGLCRIVFDDAEDEAVRIAAAQAAAACGETAVNSLCQSVSPDRPELRQAIVGALQTIGQRPMPEYFEGRLAEDLAELEPGLTAFPFVNLTLTYGADQRVVPVLLRGVDDQDPDIRASAAVQLASIGDLATATRLLATDPDPGVRAAAAQAIGAYWTGTPEPIAALRAAVEDDDPKVAKAAKAALRRLHLAKVPTPKTRRRPKAVAPAEVDPAFGWSAFLHDWSLELCGDEAFARTLDDAVVESGWTGAGPVSEGDLAELEERLGRTLPPSYRSFLLTSDGYVGGGSVQRIRPAREVRPFTDEEAEWVRIWNDAAGDETPLTIEEHVAARGDPSSARWPLLSDAIQVSDTDDGAVYLLCPAVVDDDGEWEAWLFASWLAGAARYPSWWDLLNDERRASR